MLSTQVGDVERNERNQGRRHSMTALALIAISLVLVGSGSVLLESTCRQESVDPEGLLPSRPGVVPHQSAVLGDADDLFMFSVF